MVDAIFVIPKFWFTFGVKSIMFSSSLFKISIFCHRNLVNAMSALDYMDIS